MKKTLTTLTILAFMLAAGSALAGAKLEINDEAYIDFGYRLQSYLTHMDTDLNPAEDGMETSRDFVLRRARLRVKGVINDKISIFLQSDVSGKNMQMIDAFVTYKADPWVQFLMGRNMAPSSRQATTSSGALMAIDRPGLVYKALNWGTRYKYGFNATNFAATTGIDAGDDTVRDNGLTLFGTGDMGDNGHLKYYAGMYNGGDTSGVDGNDKDHMAFRVQYNLWDAEAGYYNNSTYLGKKKTLGIGFSYDMQDEVGTDGASGDPFGYALMSADLFLELPSAAGNALTAEFGYSALDFDDAAGSEMYTGSGFYGQAGYYLASGFQPWVMYEMWGSDADENGAGQTPGDFTTLRAGVT
ncbi:MAG: porin, partial [Candidatus Krumholzibacteriia bacterium]